MSGLRLIEPIVEKGTVEPRAGPNGSGELTDILEKADMPEPTPELDRAYWYYSVPLAGVRYYGFQQRSSPEK